MDDLPEKRTCENAISTAAPAIVASEMSAIQERRRRGPPLDACAAPNFARGLAFEETTMCSSTRADRVSRYGADRLSGFATNPAPQAHHIGELPSREIMDAGAILRPQRDCELGQQQRAGIRG
jgi:hypothetical protein